MRQIELTISELFALESELLGVTYQGNIVLKGLLQQELSYVQKFRLEDIVNQVKPQRDRLNRLHEELLTIYGEEENGQVVIREFLNADEGEKAINPAFVKANEALKSFLDMEVTIQLHAFRESDFSFTGTEYYPVFNKLIRKLKEQSLVAA
ncbi:MAG TPA: hypothetical protein VL098_04900 [Flavipsychrobacter sp.]|nr:hypothetical protein [Flavipsychrobacter sp.]